jgi:dTDP-3,4-didehydro-2,6-dideoxy-alpha-D-glucose 3-reductase
MMERKINIGVLGCAAIAARSFIPAIQQLQGSFQLVAVASRSAEKAADFASRYGCEGIAGYENLLSRNDIDAVYIPLPTGLHAEWVNRALASGKHVYAEKALAMNHGEALQMVENARKFHLALMEGYMFQYHAQQRFVKKMLFDNTIGKLRHFTAAFGFPMMNPDNFRYDKQVGGGVLTDSAGYPVRAAFFYLGDNLQVGGSTLHHDPTSGTAMFGSAFLRTTNGIGASLSFGFDNFYQCNISFWGSKGIISMRKAFTPKPDEEPELWLETHTGKEIIRLPADNHFVHALEEFARTISGDQREKHYKDILLQSQAIDMIRNSAN